MNRITEIASCQMGSHVAKFDARERQNPIARDILRALTPEEISQMGENGCVCDDWGHVRVSSGFRAECVRGCSFHGFVRIGDLEPFCLESDGVLLPVGLYNSRIVACDLGKNVAIHDVRYLSRQIIGDEVMLFDIGEMIANPGTSFGTGAVCAGNESNKRNRIEVWNELGGRSVLAFEGARMGDFWLGAKFCDDVELQKRLVEMTDAQCRLDQDLFATVGKGASVLHCPVIRNVRIAPAALICGAAKLENVTICGNVDQPVYIGDAVSLSDGIVGPGCRVSTGARAQHFFLGEGAKLENGARLVHTCLGDNSTIACCEVLHSLIFPGHEQHHNNSFLIAACLEGQTGVGAGATIGSNHNSRAADGEIVAKRGFWPGLCASFKHDSYFASFTLVAKSAYPAELNVRIPFTLISNDEHVGELKIIPAYWFLYNFYALERNTWKVRARDRRKGSGQKIEFDYLAPDTVEELLEGRGLLEEWVARAWCDAYGESTKSLTPEDLRSKGRVLLTESPEDVENLDVMAVGLENSGRVVRVLKAQAAYESFGTMVRYYVARTLSNYMGESQITSFGDLLQRLAPIEETVWLNAGGQIIGSSDLEAIKTDIRSGGIKNWDALHVRFDALWDRWSTTKAGHALRVFAQMEEKPVGELDTKDWLDALDQFAEMERHIAGQVRLTRSKDYVHPYRKITYDSPRQRDVVMGPLDENVFILQKNNDMEKEIALVERLKKQEQTG